MLFNGDALWKINENIEIVGVLGFLKIRNYFMFSINSSAYREHKINGSSGKIVNIK